MRSSLARAALVTLLLCAGGCGSSTPTTIGPSPTPTPVPTPTPPIDDFAVVSSEPASGGVIHTATPPNGVTTGLRMTLTVASAADRMGMLEVFLESPRNGICLANNAPDGHPSAPDLQLKAGVPVTVTIERWRVTSVCFYPNTITTVHARLMASRDSLQRPIYEEQIPVQFAVEQ